MDLAFSLLDLEVGREPMTADGPLAEALQANYPELVAAVARHRTDGDQVWAHLVRDPGEARRFDQTVQALFAETVSDVISQAGNDVGRDGVYQPVLRALLFALYLGIWLGQLGIARIEPMPFADAPHRD